MSHQARIDLINSGRLIFTDGVQKSDLLDENLTSTYLIEMLIHLCENNGRHFQVTAVRSDHPTQDGPHGHNGGFAIDGWFLSSATEDDFIDAGSQEFCECLEDVANGPNLFQVGLAGGANTPRNQSCAGQTVFGDQGADHVHIGCTDGSF